VTDDEERELKRQLMQADLKLKQRQAFWETPRNLSIIIGTAVAITAAGAGILGYKIGQKDTPTTFIQLPPGTTITTPSH
jgi:hypothetical protein